jgi:Tol biopolymer transport system component
VIGEKIGIDRFELATSTRQPLIEDARYPAPTPDGKSMVYIATDASGGTYDTALKLLDIATKQSKSLLDKNSGFLSYFAPRPSPDGKLIVFSGVGGPDLIPPDPNAPLPSPTLTGAGRDGLGATLLKSLEPGMVSSHPLSLYRNVATHGVPFDLWLVKLDGSGLSRLTSLFEDQPIPVWSKDGKQVAFMAGFGLYIIDLDSKKLIKKSDKGVHGGFDWRE